MVKEIIMPEHTVKAYDDELEKLHQLIIHMVELTVEQIEKALKSIIERNSTLAQRVIDDDYKIDLLETNVDELTVRILALRQPVASDLRMVIAALKISNQVERIADYATNIAKRSLNLNKMEPMDSTEILPQLTEIPKQMIKKALEAYRSNNAELALHVWHMDAEVDKIYNNYIRSLITYMIEDPLNIGPCMELLFIAKNIERMGDQATNIAEVVYYMVTGTPFKEPHIQT